MKRAIAPSLLATSLFAASLAAAQTPPASSTPDPTEETGAQQEPTPPGPIVFNWHMHRIDGTTNLTVNPDGTYLFSGNVKDKKAGKDFEIVVGLKSSLGGVILFKFAGDAANGVQWSKQGQSDILKDNFASFGGKHSSDGVYHFYLSAEGRAKLYQEREKKKAELKKEEEEAKKRHDEKVAAEKRQEEQAEYQAELQWEQQQAAINSARSAASSALGTLGSIASAVLSFL